MILLILSKDMTQTCTLSLFLFVIEAFRLTPRHPLAVDITLVICTRQTKLVQNSAQGKVRRQVLLKLPCTVFLYLQQIDKP